MAFVIVSLLVAATSFAAAPVRITLRMVPQAVDGAPVVATLTIANTSTRVVILEALDPRNIRFDVNKTHDEHSGKWVLHYERALVNAVAKPAPVSVR